jgi:hypothetical protein
VSRVRFGRWVNGVTRFAAGVAVMASVVCIDQQPSGAARPAASSTPTWASIGTNPWAASQPTVTGRKIIELEAIGDEVYVGYGDYGANTGPITLSKTEEGGGYSPIATLATEAVMRIQSIGGKVVVPFTDPRSSEDIASGEPWLTNSSLGATHAYDAVTRSGGDVWVAGSKDRSAMLWRSVDGGTSWQIALEIAPTRAEYCRFYFAATYRSNLVVQPKCDFSTYPAYSFDGSSWSEVPGLISGRATGWNPVEFSGQLLLQSGPPGSLSDLIAYDGARVTSLLPVLDYEVVGNSVYALTRRGRLMRTSDLATWTEVATAPRDASSLAVHGRDVLVGTEGSEVWKSQNLVPAA